MKKLLHLVFLLATMFASAAGVMIKPTTIMPSCNGGGNGYIHVDIVGGIAPYTYLWSDGSTGTDITNLTAGNYDITVTDQTPSTVTATIVLYEPGTLTATGEGVNDLGTGTACIYLTVTGGTVPYGFNWSDGETVQSPCGLSAGTYSVTVTDFSGCSTSTAVTVSPAIPPMLRPVALNNNSPSVLPLNNNFARPTHNHQSRAGSAFSLKPTVNFPICNGSSDGNIDLMAVNGNAPYTFAWSNGATTASLSNIPAGTYDVTATDVDGNVTNASIIVTQPDAIVPTGSPVSTFGGSSACIMLDVKGGTVPYQFSWSNGSTVQNPCGLGLGTYDVTVTDAFGCTATSSTTINTLAPIHLITKPFSPQARGGSAFFLKPVVNLPVCHGGSEGSIDLVSVNGNAPYTFAWSNGATTASLTNITAGTYDVTATDVDGNIANASIVLTEPDAVVATGAAVSDFGGSGTSCITLVVKGGTNPYQYNWDNGSLEQNPCGLNPGTYSVSVTDAVGCTTTASVIVGGSHPVSYYTTHVSMQEKDASDFTVTPIIASPTCYGMNNGSITLIKDNGIPPFTYLWSDSSTGDVLMNVSAGTYMVTVTDSASTMVRVQIDVTQPDAIVANGHITTSLGGGSGCITVDVSGGTAPYTYLWGNGSTDSYICGVNSGDYEIKITDTLGCLLYYTDTVNTANIPDDSTIVGSLYPTVLSYQFLATGTQANKFQNPEVSVYPNPVASFVNIRMQNFKNAEITLTNILGEKVLSVVATSETNSLNIAGLSEGPYLVTVRDALGNKATNRILKAK